MRIVYLNLYITHTVTIPELLWTLFTLIGLVYTTILLHRATNDLTYIRENHINHYREFSAITTMTMFMVLAANQFTYVLIGVISLLTAPPGHNVITPVSWALVVLFIMNSFIFDMVAFIVYSRKRKLVNMIAEDIEHGRIRPPDHPNDAALEGAEG